MKLNVYIKRIGSIFPTNQATLLSVFLNKSILAATAFNILKEVFSK